MSSRTGPLEIGLKYCGGCKPYYDRVALVEQIQKQIVGKALLVPPETGGICLLLAVHGCPTACADLTPFGQAPIFSITHPGDAERFIDHLQTLKRQKESVMTFSREEIQNSLKEWNLAWGRYDLEGVMALMHDEVLFENWTGGKAAGKEALRKAWQPWFAQGDFQFIEEELFVDEKEQKALFRWTLQWPCPEEGYEGKLESRKGVDVIHFKDGKIINKLTYSKTTIEIDGQRHKLRM